MQALLDNILYLWHELAIQFQAIKLQQIFLKLFSANHTIFCVFEVTFINTIGAYMRVQIINVGKIEVFRGNSTVVVLVVISS